MSEPLSQPWFLELANARDRVVEAALEHERLLHPSDVGFGSALCEAVRALRVLTAQAKEGIDGR